MGSPIDPVLANIFIVKQETNFVGWMIKSKSGKV